MKITIIIYKRLFDLFPNLITKESYNWWVKRRVWGFRYQISKAKISQNISQCRSHISGSFGRTPWHCAKWLRNSPGKRYKRIRICVTGQVETLSSPIVKIPDVKHPGVMAAAAEFRMWTFGWNGGSRFPDVIHPSGKWRHPGGSGGNWM